MRLAIYCVLAIVIFGAVILTYATTKPNELQIRRTIVIDASPERIFALINDFTNGEIGRLKTEKIQQCAEPIVDL